MKMLNTKKGSGKIATIVVEIIFVTALIPVVVTFITSAKSNLSATEQIVIGLVTLFLVLGLAYMVAKQMGLVGGRN